METSSLQEAWRLIEAAEKAEELRKQTTQNLSAVLKRVHSKHIFTLEAMIGRYQADLEKAARADKKPVARIAQLKDLAQLYVPQAVAAGYQRGLSDLKTNGWVSKYIPVTPATAPQGVIQSILTDNEKYLTTSLLPDLQAGMSDKARIARIKLYGHFLWKAAERAYIQAMIDFQTAVKARDRQDKVKESMVEGGTGSGNWDHVGRPGQRGGSGSTGDLNDKLRKIAQIYSDAKHDPQNPATQKAYAAFIKETLDQYHDLKAAGYKFDFEDKGEPYKDQPDMRRSVEQTKTLFVRSSQDDLPQDSPLSKVVEDGQTANTIFRGVHDMYGHFFPDNTFGQRGEFKAYQAHGRMYSKDALPALAAETLAQNAWVNHSPENESKPVSQRSFPEQKSFAFPVEIADEMRHSYFPELQDHRKYREGGVGSGNYGHDGRPGQRGGSAGGGSSIVPNIIARSIVRDGGITISTTGIRPRSGFAIAGIRNAAGDKVETIIHGEAKPEDVQKFVNENKDILSQPNHYIGGWVNDGKTYLDVSEVQNDKATALDKAEARDEIAIYDLGSGEEHFTREDHLRPSESRAGRAA